jgi:type VI secretion system secreted protein VgrG
MFTLRSIEVISPVGGDDIVLERMWGSEALGRLFEFSVDLLSTKEDLDMTQAVGKGLTVAMTMGNLPPRFFNGLVTRFSQVAWTGDRFRYRAEIRPWLWLLSRNSDSRIFQNKTVPTVLAEIFEQHGLSGVVDDDGLDAGNYKPHEYLVQYNETDFNFVSRLMEQAGISYYFKHDQDNHKMILFDGPISNDSPELVPFFPGDSAGVDSLSHQHIGSWSVGVQIEPGSFVAKEFDFTNPKAPLLSARNDPGPGSTRAMEMFEYPGLYIDDQAREAYVARKIQEEQLDSEQAHGAGNVRSLGAGTVFKMTDYPWTAQNKSYLVIAASHELISTDYSSGGTGAQADYAINFFAIDAKRQYRTPTTTPRPRVAGPQTAVVCGPDGEEIFTDPTGYGQVKVQFHWDRADAKGEDRSCWVRVSQVWAGGGWGAIHIPRIGQEVIVDFLEGDPDRPIITGRVYNKDQPVPYTLPQNKTQSGIKSRSTPKAGPSNFNEIRFEDKKGNEELHIQAERDQTTHVKRNQSISVDGDRSISVGGNESTSVTGNRSATITGNETQTFKANREMRVTGTNLDEITGAHTGTYKAGRTETVSKGDTLTVVGSDKTVTVHGNYNTTADTQFQVLQGSNKLLIKDAVEIDSQGQIYLHRSGAAIQLDGSNITVQADAQLTLKCGGASITLKKDGSIDIQGSQKVSVSGGGATVDLSAAGAEMSGTKAKLAGVAMTEISGAMVKIN